MSVYKSGVTITNSSQSLPHITAGKQLAWSLSSYV